MSKDVKASSREYAMIYIYCPNCEKKVSEDVNPCPGCGTPMGTIQRTLGGTSQTLVDIIKGPDCQERRERVNELARVYQPVWDKVAKWTLLKYNRYENATLDAQDIVGDEIVRMLDPENDYFKTKDPHRKGLRAWIKMRIRNSCIDMLRHKGVEKKGIKKEVKGEKEGAKNIKKEIDPEEIEDIEEKYAHEIDHFVNVQEMFELFKQALKIADQICSERGISEKMEIFRKVKLCKDTDYGDWTEWQRRCAVSEVWDLIRDEAIPEATLKVANNPGEAEIVAKELWDQLRNRKVFDVPT